MRVTGTSRIDAHIGNGAGKPVLSGVVADDTGRPLPRASVVVSMTSEANGAPTHVALSSAAPEACRDEGIRPVLESAERILLLTDDSGRFCVRLALPIARYVGHLATRATKLLDATTLDLPFDLALKSVILRFDPVPAILSLDDETTTLDVAVSTEDRDLSSPAASLRLRLSNESGSLLGEAVTTAGRARFVVPSVRLGPPGDGELRVLFEGTREIDRSSLSQWIERRTRIRIAAADAAGGTLPAGAPEDGIAVAVVAKADCTDRGCQVVPTGVVEMHVGDVLVGAAPLVRGTALVTATWLTESRDDVDLRVRYRPDAPWFQPTEEEERLVQPVRSRKPWAKLATSLAGIAVLVWFILPRLPTRRRADWPVRSPQPPEVDGHGAPAATPPDGWTGRVIDAHDGSPIVGASLRVERPGFLGADVIGTTVSIANGVFALVPMKASAGDQLVVGSPMHSTSRRSLPPFGHVDVPLVDRKRALLERLVAWAKAKGGRFDAKPEPTPAHIRHAAGSDSRVGGWADAVERAIYGGAVVDAKAQSAIDRLDPDARAAGSTEGLDLPEPQSPDGTRPP